MATKPNKLAYELQYQKETYQRVSIKINKATESDLLEHLLRQENKQAYIKRLIMEDMERSR